MTGSEKPEAGPEYNRRDPEVNDRKLEAVDGCRLLRSIGPKDGKAVREAVIRLFGSTGADP